MRCPTLGELPPPPHGRHGWPWTEESDPLAPSLEGEVWPRISIVTPSYNQGEFIEETIRAILLQGYPNIEYIIVDGGSIDNTTEIIKKYESHIAYWVSEKDRGQSHAINKGFERTTGEIYFWINSDDFPAKNTFGFIANAFRQEPDVDVIYGDNCDVDQHSRPLQLTKFSEFSTGELIARNRIGQAETYFRSSTWKKYGLVNESLHFIMDYELWIRWALENVRFRHCPRVLAYFRIHEKSKTQNLLMRVAQVENIALLYDLYHSKKLPHHLRPQIIEGIYFLCQEAYFCLDPRRLWINLFHYVRLAKRLPPPSMLLRGILLLLGKRFNKFLSSLKRTLITKYGIRITI